jgi:hypothetical protein
LHDSTNVYVVDIELNHARLICRVRSVGCSYKRRNTGKVVVDRSARRRPCAGGLAGINGPGKLPEAEYTLK